MGPPDQTRKLGGAVGSVLEGRVMEGALALADRESWAEAQFGTADLEDRRRTRRLVKVAAQMAGHRRGTFHSKPVAERI